MTQVYLGLGSNLQGSQRQLRAAIKSLRYLPLTSIQQVAPFYFSEAWGRKGQPNFCNTVVAINTQLLPHKLLYYCQKIENKQGRLRLIRWGARTLDIDLLFYGQQTIKTSNLIIPHPRILQRPFVYEPLLKITPDIAFPNGQKLVNLIEKII